MKNRWSSLAQGDTLMGSFISTGYPINTDDPVAPFIAEIVAAKGDVMMCGHVDYLLRSASRLVCGDEKRKGDIFRQIASLAEQCRTELSSHDGGKRQSGPAIG